MFPGKILFQEKEILLHWWHEYRVNHMNDTVGGLNISDDHLCVGIQENFPIRDLDGHILAKHSSGAAHFDHIGSHDLTRNNMIEQDI